MGIADKIEYRFSMNDGGDAVDEEAYDEEVYDDEYYDDEYDGDEEYYDDAEGEYYEDDPKTYDGEYDQVLPDEDKLERVLNELAELRRSVGIQGDAAQPSAQVSYAALPYMPSYATGGPMVITPPTPASSSGTEIVMYNELTRLREEISKVNSSHEMHVELSRLKEEMEREAQKKEAQLQEEIRRLNEKIGDLSGRK